MHRDMKKLIREYNLRFANGYNTKQRYYFTVDEYRQIFDSSSDRYDALSAGFVCGYRAAQMDARDQGKKAPQAPKIPRKKPGMYHDDDKENTLPF